MRRLGVKERDPVRGDTAGTPLETAFLDVVRERVRHRRLYVRRGSIVCTGRLPDGSRLAVATGQKIQCAHVDGDFRGL